MNILLGIIAGLIAIIGVIGVGFALALLNAFVLVKLWAWFVVPLFALPSLSLAYAYGLMLIAGFFSQIQHKKMDEDERKTYLISSLAKPFMILLVGYITKTYFIG